MKPSMIAMLGMAFMLESVAMHDAITLNEPPSKGSNGGKLKKGLKFKRVYAGDKPYIKSDSTSRNDVCPCGSGKKYKKCCM